MPNTIMTIRRILAVTVTVVLIGSPPMLSERILAQVGAVINDLEAYAVYAAVVPVGFASRDKPLTNITLLKETRGYIPCPLDEAIQPLWHSVVESYQNENNRARVIQPGFDLGVPYSVVTSAELRELVQHSHLSTFSGRQSPGTQVFAGLPGGRLVVVSAVGFNEEKTRAMVSVRYDCTSSLEPGKADAGCYQGYQLMLEKRDGRWVLAPGQRQCTWVD